ncbi:hypothetical protein M9H77_03027 [Catharanthus roseus]|uniref:Uncharacterized protein n=1 Tax=Catharanthus roseus TaxID=4058 RepID=A0ACC0CA18_CATRO|nr:hypothetical protein M9H77_03027 [Catharanthus roseus]
MVKVKNANVGRGENFEQGGSSRGRTGKGKRVASGVRGPERFIPIEEAANFEEWTRKRGKIAPGHKVDLSDMEVIPNVSHKSSITNIYSFVMLALHEQRRMNFGYMAIDHMLVTQMSSTKYLPYGCFLTKVFQYFVLYLVGVGDLIRARKIYNKHTFKRTDFAKNEEGMSVRGEQDDDDESVEDDEGMKGKKNIDEEESEIEPEEETYRREMRQRKGKNELKKANHPEA